MTKDTISYIEKRDYFLCVEQNTRNPSMNK